MIHQTACRAAKINPANTATGAGKLLRVLATKLQGGSRLPKLSEVEAAIPLLQQQQKKRAFGQKGKTEVPPRSEQFPTP